MDYLQTINNALDYIESNLTSEIDFKEVGKVACCSPFYFQRVFSFIAGVPLSEYIRRRRLTLAAFELQHSSIKIIDLSIKYGYESPDSFTRAFQNIHGITPTHARNKGIQLKAFPRISFQISIKGDVAMNYRIEEKESFRIVGVKRSYKSPDTSDIVPAFWNELHELRILNEIAVLQNGTPKGVHGFIQIVGEDAVDYSIACISDVDPPKGMASQIVPKSTWAIFEVAGPVPVEMENTYKRIFAEWFPTSGYRDAETVSIECFLDGDKFSPNYKYEIWIPIKK